MLKRLLSMQDATYQTYPLTGMYAGLLMQVRLEIRPSYNSPMGPPKGHFDLEEMSYSV